MNKFPLKNTDRLMDFPATSTTNLIHVSLTYFQEATSENTRKAYQTDIKAFMQWGGQLPCTTQGVLQYLESQASSLNPRTLTRRVIALKQWHVTQQLSDPTAHPLVRKTLSGIRRTHGKPKRQAKHLTLSLLRQLIQYCDAQQTLASIRNKALLLIGFFGALRGSELVGIQVADLQFEAEGLRIQLSRSKTDQTREGQVVTIAKTHNDLCAINALQAWLAASEIQSNSVFRSMTKTDGIREKSLTANSLNPLFKALAKAANIPDAEHISSHSLRRGFATEASRKGLSLKTIMKQGRWQDVKTVLAYIDAGQAYSENAVTQLMA